MAGLKRRIPLVTLVTFVILQQLASMALAQSVMTTFFIWGNADIVSLLSPTSLTFLTPHTSAFHSSPSSVLAQPNASSPKTTTTSSSSSSISVLDLATSSLLTGSSRSFSTSPSDTPYLTETVPPKLWSTFATEAAQSITITPAHTPLHHTTSTPYHSDAFTSPLLSVSHSITSETLISPASIGSSSSFGSLHIIPHVSLHTADPLHSAPPDPRSTPLSSLLPTSRGKQAVFSTSSPLSSSSSFPSSSSSSPPPFTPVTNPPSSISSGLDSPPLSFSSSGGQDPESEVFAPSGTDSTQTRRSDEVLSLPEVESSQTGGSSPRQTSFSSGDSKSNPGSGSSDPDFQAQNTSGTSSRVPSNRSELQTPTPDVQDEDPNSSPKLLTQKLSETISFDSFITEINSLNDNVWSDSLGHFGNNDLSGIPIPFNSNTELFGNVTVFLTEPSPTTSNVVPLESSSSSSTSSPSPTFDPPSNTPDLLKAPKEILPGLPKSNSSPPVNSDNTFLVNHLTPRPFSALFRGTPPIHHPLAPISLRHRPRTLPSGGSPNTGSQGQSGFSFSSPRGSLPTINGTSRGFFDENSFGRRPDERTSLFFDPPRPWDPTVGPRQWQPTLPLVRSVRGLSLQKMEGLASIPPHFLPVKKMSFYLNETSPAQARTWLRLSGGRGPHEGRVEILVEGAWGTVCDQDFDFYDAQVICRMLGYWGTAWAHRGAVFGPGTGTVWIDGLDCRGFETSLQGCVIFGGAGRSECRHERDAGVTCFHANVETVDQDLAILLPRESCGVPTDGSHVFLSSLAKVVGGRDLLRFEMPWLVAIVSRQGTTYKHHCGAALLSEDLILTAAHCFRRHGHLNLVVRVGDYWLNKNDNGQQDFEVDTIFVNPKFDAVIKSNNDIALVRIKRKFGRGVKMGAFVQPVCLPPETTDYRNPENCQAVGWGRVVEDQAGTSDIPQVARAELYELDQCVGEDGYALSDVTSSMICAGRIEGGEGVCRGDSGGPLTCRGVDGRYYLLGILSRVHGCGLVNKPALFTRVTKFLRWIRDTMI